MKPFLFEPALSAVPVFQQQGCCSLMGMSPAGMRPLRRPDQLPVVFLIAAVPEGRLTVIMLFIQSQPFPCGNFDCGNIAERAVVKHLAPHPVYLPPEARFNKVPENPPVHRLLCPILFHLNHCHYRLLHPFPIRLFFSYSVTFSSVWQSSFHRTHHNPFFKEFLGKGIHDDQRQRRQHHTGQLNSLVIS